ncbi:MAG: hypothetical protein KGN39_06600 [Betaproteobacteria bacterium]|nr:hypothetical protein [Betaproteobacteria bacterium]
MNRCAASLPKLHSLPELAGIAASVVVSVVGAVGVVVAIAPRAGSDR